MEIELHKQLEIIRDKKDVELPKDIVKKNRNFLAKTSRRKFILI